jgi:hypothetical protein
MSNKLIADLMSFRARMVADNRTQLMFEGDFDTIDQAIATLRKATITSPQQAIPSGWISVKDRLPEKNTDCIVWMPSRGTVMVCKYFNTWSLVLMPDSKEPPITHWVPLPSSPTAPIERDK